MTAKPAIKLTQFVVNAFLTLAAIAAAFASYAVYAHDRAARIPAQSFAEKFTLTLRSPEIVESLRYAPSPDFANDLVADATLRDVAVPVNLTGLPADVRTAWLDAVARRDEQTTAATSLMLDAITGRPGWPYHSQLLGQLVYTQNRRNLSPDLIAKPETWSVPMLRAAQAAPADGLQWQSLALAYLETWPALRGQHSSTAPTVFRNAFDDVAFVRLALGPALQIAGKGTVLPLLPESPQALREAFRQLAASGDVEAAWQLHRRWDAAEWAARTTDLRLIEKTAVRGDVERIRHLCTVWASAHSVWDYDSQAAHAQAARVLEFWPAGRGGTWRHDPRASIVKYMLSRPGIVTTTGPLKAIESLDYVPTPILAECQLLAGDFRESWRTATADPTFGLSNEWTSYVLAAVRRLLDRGDSQSAKEVAQRLSASAAKGCSGRAIEMLSSEKHRLRHGQGSRVALGLTVPHVICAADIAGTKFQLPEVVRTTIADIVYDDARRETVLLTPSTVQMVTIDHQPGRHSIVVNPLAQ